MCDNGKSEALRHWLPLAGWLGLVAAIIACADKGWAPRLFALLGHVPLGDKAGHFALIGTLAWLLNYALLRRKVTLGFWRVQLGSLIIALLMTAEEASQIWIPGRHFDFGDLAANYAGIACAGLLTRRW
jgi:polysaccharide biosynthesis protein VpsQ